MKLTKSEALIKCRDMWQKLADSGSGWKRDALEDVDNPINDCWLCEEAHQGLSKANSKEFIKRCENCLLINYWENFHGTDIQEVTPCQMSASPYTQWEEATIPASRKKYAQQIVDACQKTLDKMGVK